MITKEFLNHKYFLTIINKHNCSCSWDVFNSEIPNHNVLYGAMVGGPNDQDVFDDDRRNFKQSEVALDYNAGFQVKYFKIIFKLL